MQRHTQITYANMINVLFGGVISASPDQITPELVEMTDKMFSEIATCHERIRPLAILMDGIAGSFMKLMPPGFIESINFITGNSNEKTLTEYVKSKGRDSFFKRLKQLMESRSIDFDVVKANNAAKVLEAFVESWLKYTAKDKKLKICIISAQVKWRSKFELELLGI